jgi:hypothetical protein
MADPHIDRETLTKFHQPDRKLLEVQDRERKAGSEKERREIRRDYYRQGRAEQERNGEGRKYADRRDMVNNSRKDRPANYHHEIGDRTDRG